MGQNRGSRAGKRGKLAWKTRKANRGRKPGMGKRKHFMTWPEVRAKMLRHATKIVTPPKETEETEAPAQAE